MLIIIGEAEAAPGRGDEMLAAATTVATATKSDDGCESYGFYADATRPGVVVSIEVWRDQAALDAHMEHGHTQEFLAAIPGLVAGEPTMRFYSAEPTAPGPATPAAGAALEGAR